MLPLLRKYQGFTGHASSDRALIKQRELCYHETSRKSVGLYAGREVNRTKTETPNAVASEGGRGPVTPVFWAPEESDLSTKRS